MKPYPKVKDTPNRNQRKSQRRKIFQENMDAMEAARKARREARRTNNGTSN